MCEFSAKIPAFYRRLQLRRHAMRKVFFQRVFLLKKVKNILEFESNSFVCFVVDEENCRELGKQKEGKKLNET